MIGPPVDGRGRRRDGRAEAFHVGRDLRELGDGELRPVGQHDGAEHGVLELAHVAGPGVAGDQLQRLLADAVDAPALLGGEPRQEVHGELRHVLEALAQRRHPDREDVEAVVEVLAELAVLDQLDHVAVGRRDQAEVDLDRLLGADRIDLALLQGAQQLDLRLERQLADLVEEQRAAVGLLELADALVDGAGERALLVAEQDALDQVLGDGAAVDGDEGLGLARRSRPGWRARSAPCRRRSRPRSARGCWRRRRGVRATTTRCMAWPRTMRSPKASVPSAFFLMRAISPCSASILSALLIDTSRRSGEVGLTTKSTAPARMAVMAASMEPCAVCTMIGGVPGLGARRRSTSMPSTPGMTWSSRTRAIAARSGPSRICRACSPPWAVRGLETETADRFFEDATLGGIVVDDQDELGHVAGTRLNTTGYRVPPRPTQHRTVRPRMTYSAERRVPHMGKCIVSFRPALMLYCRVLDGGHSCAPAGVASARTCQPCGSVARSRTFEAAFARRRSGIGSRT